MEAHKVELKRVEKRHEAELARRAAAALAAQEEALAAARSSAAADKAAALEAEKAAAYEAVKAAQGRCGWMQTMGWGFEAGVSCCLARVCSAWTTLHGVLHAVLHGVHGV